MQLTGVITEVVTEPTHSAVETDVSAGATAVDIESAVGFPPAGTVLITDIDIATVTASETATYEAIDTATGTLTLTDPLANAYDAGALVELTVPSRPTTIAYVRTSDDQPDLAALVPQEFRAVHSIALADGIRDPDTGAAVVVDERYGQWRIVQVAAPPQIAGGDVVGAVPSSDGIAPSIAPVVTAKPFAVGAVQGSWEPVSNDDPILHYQVNASLTSPVLEDESARVMLVNATKARIGDINGVPIPVGAPVYMIVRAFDADGYGPWSAEVSAVPLASDAYITAAWIAALEIEAQQIAAGTIDADLGLLSRLVVGGSENVVIDGLTSSITIYSPVLDSEGNKVPLVQLKPEGSVFRGRVEADEVSVLQGLILLGTESQIAAGAGVTIMSGIADPQSPPTVTGVLQSAPWPAVPSGYQERGTAYVDGEDAAVRLLVPTTASLIDGSTKIQSINTTTGAVAFELTLGNWPSVTIDDYNSVCVDADSGIFYVMALNTGVGWTIGSFNLTTGAFIAESPTTVWAEYGSANRPAIGRAAPTSSAELVTAIYLEGASGWENGVYAKFRNADMSHFLWAAPGQLQQTFDATTDGGKEVMAIEHSLDGPEPELFITRGTKWRRYHYDGSEFIKDVSSIVTLSSTVAKGGLFHKADGADQGLYTVHNTGQRWRYSDYVETAGEKVWVTYANNDGTDTTLDSPAGSAAIGNGRFAQVSLPPAPSGITGARVFAAIDTSTPTDAELDERLETLTPSRTLLFDPTVAGGAGAPPAANTFAGGGTGWLKSADGGLELWGSGILNAPKKMQAGTVSITPSAADTSTPVHVDFDVPFDTVPVVTTDVNTTNSGSVITSHATGITTTGFDARLVVHSRTTIDPTPSLSARTVAWHAMVP